MNSRRKVTGALRDRLAWQPGDVDITGQKPWTAQDAAEWSKPGKDPAVIADAARKGLLAALGIGNGEPRHGRQ